jgi:hypothetical protein
LTPIRHPFFDRITPQELPVNNILGRYVTENCTNGFIPAVDDFKEVGKIAWKAPGLFELV